MDGQVKVGLRNAVIILLIVAVMVPMLKIGTEKVDWIPEGIKNWIRSI